MHVQIVESIKKFFPTAKLQGAADTESLGVL